jgi:hypothetical protein
LNHTLRSTVVVWHCSGCLTVLQYICKTLACLYDDFCLQLLTSSIKWTCCMAPSWSFARQLPARKWQPDQSIFLQSWHL